MGRPSSEAGRRAVRQYQKRQAALAKEVRGARDRYYEAFTVEKRPGGFWCKWTFTAEQLEVVSDAAGRHGMDVDTFLHLGGASGDEPSPGSSAEGSPKP